MIDPTALGLFVLDALLSLALLLCLYLHKAEREEWGRERKASREREDALIERLTGATIRAVVETAPRPYGDEGEWLVEQQRRGGSPV